MTSHNSPASFLEIEKVNLQTVATTVGTPCYVYSHATLTQRWQAFNDALAPYPHKICYAVKANSNLAVLQALAQKGSGFDIVSQGELMRVLKAGGKPQQIVFSGVGKTAQEMEKALLANIFCFNVESASELKELNRVATYLNVRAPVAIRVNPHIEANAHPYLATALQESKFGIEMEEAFSLYQAAASFPHLSFEGIACHIGSQLTSLAPLTQAVSCLVDFLSKLKATGCFLRHIDIGGGIGITYQNETPPTAAEYANAILPLLPSPPLTLIVEPGRAIAGPSGFLLTKVLYLKETTHKRFCIVDCAMNDFLRPTLYHAWHNIRPLQLSSSLPAACYDVVGPVCESGDFLGKDRLLSIKVGDYLAIECVGA